MFEIFTSPNHSYPAILFHSLLCPALTTLPRLSLSCLPYPAPSSLVLTSTIPSSRALLSSTNQVLWPGQVSSALPGHSWLTLGTLVHPCLNSVYPIFQYSFQSCILLSLATLLTPVLKWSPQSFHHPCPVLFCSLLSIPAQSYPTPCHPCPILLPPCPALHCPHSHCTDYFIKTWG